tara:strand:- start:43846 stop:47097 length:3252 start_codon:yes stop_codon:yes gene_type:complete
MSIIANPNAAGCGAPGGGSQPLVSNAFRLRNVFYDPAQDYTLPYWLVVIQSINYSIQTYYGGTVTCAAGQQIVFVLTRSEFVNGQFTMTRDYFALNSGALTLNSVDTIEDISPMGRFTEGIDPVGNALVIDLGDIEDATIVDGFNAHENAPYEIDGDRFIRVIMEGVNKLFFWNGGTGTFGAGETLAVAEDFIDLTEAEEPTGGGSMNYLMPEVFTGAALDLSVAMLNRLAQLPSDEVTLTLNETTTELAYASGVMSVKTRVEFLGAGPHTVIDPDENEYVFGQGDLVWIERRKEAADGWVVKLWGGDIDESKWEIADNNPYGLRIPTSTEWDNERLSWSTNNAAGGFGSPLKLTLGGTRRHYDGDLISVGALGGYFSSTAAASSNSSYLLISASSAQIGPNFRALGYSLRLIVDGTFTLQEFEDNYENEIFEFQGLSYGFVYNPTTDRIWLDRNLGASQVATSSTDADAYGDLYQWGRSPDGHQLRSSGLHNGNVDGKPSFAKESGNWDGKFILTADVNPRDWLDPADDNLWQGLDGFNESFGLLKLIGKDGLKADYDDLLNKPLRPDPTDNNRPEWDNGTEWKGLAYKDEIPEQYLLEQVYSESLPISGLTPPEEFNDQLKLQRIYDGEKVRYIQDPYDKIDFTLTETATNYYVDYVNGNNANDGLTEGTAWKTLKYATDQSLSPCVINIMDEWVGWLNKDTNPMQLRGKWKFKSIHPSGKTRITSMRENYTKATFNWFDEGGGVWSTSTATTNSTIFAALGRIVFDAKYKDEKGGAMPVPDVGSEANCAATPGSQYHDAANSIKYVHLLDGREPDPFDGFIYATQAYNWAVTQNTDDGVVLLEDLEFYHNSGTSPLAGCRYRHATTATNNSLYGVKDCLSYGSSGNGFETYDAKITVYKNCHSRYQRKDGFNTHSFKTVGTKGEYMTVYELDCSAIFQGYDGFTNQPALGDSENATSVHDSIHCERINGNYGEGRGATVADVNGCVSVLWNCNAGASNGGNFKSCYWSDNYLKAGANFGMWLWGCKAHDNDDDTVRLLNNEAQAGGTANDGQLYLKYWRGKIKGTVTGTLKYWDGNDITV